METSRKWTEMTPNAHSLSQVCQCLKGKRKYGRDDNDCKDGRKLLGCIDALPLTPLSRVTPTTIRVLHILKRFVLLLAFVRASLNLKLHILQREEAKIEAQESRITVLPNVVKSRHFGIPLKMFTSSSSPSPSGASEGNDTTHYKAFGSSILEMSV